MKNLPLCVLAIASVSCICPAQGFYWNSASASARAMGGIYEPSPSGAMDALGANPAGLADLDRPVVEGSLSGVFVRGSFSNSVNSNSPLSTSPGAVPSGAFGAPLIRSRIYFGAGAVPELTSLAEWHYLDAPGTAGASYGLQREISAILALRTSAGVGINIAPALSVGLSVGADYNSNTLEAPYTFQSQPEVKSLKTLLHLHTTGFGSNVAAGALIRPSRKVEVGLSWKSRTVIESTGTAFGSLSAQFAALGIEANPDYHYNAKVRNVLPQSFAASAYLHASPRWKFALQGDLVNWNSAFKTLPVDLTNGDNAAVNRLLGSTTLDDGVPLNWRNQYSVRGGVEHELTEMLSVRGGFAHSNNPIPSNTLIPLTAAIFSDQFSGGLSWRHGRTSVDAAYSFDPTASASVGKSAILSGEFDNSTVKAGIQAFTVTSSLRF